MPIVKFIVNIKLFIKKYVLLLVVMNNVFFRFGYVITLFVYMCNLTFAQDTKLVLNADVKYDTVMILELLNEAKEIIEPNISIGLYNQTLKLSVQQKFHYGYIRSLNGIGVNLYKLGDNAGANNYFNKSVQYILKNETLYDHLAGIFSNKAATFMAIGQYDSTIQNYFTAVSFFEKYPSKTFSVASIYNNLAILLNSLSRYEDAIVYLLKSLDFARSNKDSVTECAIYQNLGVAYIGLDEKENHIQAVYYLEKALNMSREYKWSEVEKNCLTSLGNFYFKKRKKNNSYLEKALHFYRAASLLSSGLVYSNITANANLGYCLFYLNRLDEAEEMITCAMQEARVINADILPNTYAMLAKVYKAKKKYEKATFYYDLYIDLMDTIKGHDVKDKIKRIEYKYEEERKEKEYFRKELELSKQQIALQKKNLIAYCITGGVIVLVGLIMIYLFYKRRSEKVKSKQLLEKSIWKATLEGEERERKRLAKELHDNIGGNLSTVKTWLANINKRISKEEALSKDVVDVEKMVAHTLTEVRNTAHHLMPELLLQLGLTEAVRIYCLNVQKATGIDFQFHYFGYIGELSKESELIIYRIVQELVQNIVKHSAATIALVQMSLHETKLTITVEDNGRGLQEKQNEESVGVGLMSIQTTVAHMGGLFSMNSESGTTVEIELNTENLLSDKISVA